MNGRQLLALVDRLAVGWTKWKDRRPVDYRVGFVAEGFRPPSRNDLDDLDESTWETDGKGQPLDPWAFGFHLPLLDTESAEQFIYTTGTQGGRNAIGELAQAYADQRAGGDNLLPLVELGSDSYDHSRYGAVQVPLLTIGTWLEPPDAGRQAPQAALPSTPMEGPAPASKPPTNAVKRKRDDDMDDEIPFN